MSVGDSVELPPDDPSFDITDAADVRALLHAEERHFWHRSRNDFISRQLARIGVAPGASILELGCGAGCVAAALARDGYEVTGVDGHRSLIDVARSRAPQARFICRDLRAGVAEVAAGSFDAVCLFDVIEHLESPESALKMALEFARPGGYVVGTVPALMSLWSAIDEHSGHRLRYSHSTLRDVLSRARGGTIVEVVPFFRLLVPMMWLQRRLIGRRPTSQAAVRNMTVPPRPLNEALFGLTSLEHALAGRLGRLPIPGASLWFALRRDSLRPR